MAKSYSELISEQLKELPGDTPNPGEMFVSVSSVKDSAIQDIELEVHADHMALITREPRKLDNDLFHVRFIFDSDCRFRKAMYEVSYAHDLPLPFEDLDPGMTRLELRRTWKAIVQPAVMNNLAQFIPVPEET